MSLLFIFWGRGPHDYPWHSNTPTPLVTAVACDRDLCQKTLGLYQVPLLDPPPFHPEMPPSLESNFEGEVYLRWLAVRKAKSYFITVTDESGAEIRTYRTPYVAIYLKGLPRPTNKDREKYLIKLATVNANDLVGPFSSPRVLFVKKPIDLTAPKIKDIRVED